MDLATIIDGTDRFVAYAEELTNVIGHADRALPLRNYCAGLLTAEGRKSVEPMAAVTSPAQVSVQHQKLLHFVGEGKWSDESPGSRGENAIRKPLTERGSTLRFRFSITRAAGNRRKRCWASIAITFPHPVIARAHPLDGRSCVVALLQSGTDIM
jgi:DDE superfamily endonuclease